ncbi:MAG: hypothetical protein J07HB67_02358 [halophilic archaeon J07HB67]|nr:MAG: hypothetical protein J07HB67_02358 [halophilic archaeon J07HB67]
MTAREDGYDAVVYDLDGTLVDLAVSWDTVTSDARELFAAHGHETDEGLWGMLDTASAVGLQTELEAVIADHERAGAEASSLAPCATELPLTVPTGVCSLNSESACRVALDTHGLVEHGQRRRRPGHRSGTETRSGATRRDVRPARRRHSGGVRRRLPSGRTRSRTRGSRLRVGRHGRTVATPPREACRARRPRRPRRSRRSRRRPLSRCRRSRPRR